MALLDTDVIVDCLREVPAAESWLAANAGEQFILPGIVAMELVAGCRDNEELRQLRRYLAGFNIEWPDAADTESAFELLAAHRLRIGMSIPNSIVASMAIRRGQRLYSLNVRHFSGIADLEVEAPYSR